MNRNRYAAARVSVALLMLTCTRIAVAGAAERPIRLGPGPHLFIDDYLIASSNGLARVTNAPERLQRPVLQGTDPWNESMGNIITVVRSQASPRFRMWYGVKFHQFRGPYSQYACAESEDGRSWKKPLLNLIDDPPNNMIKSKRGFGLMMTDDGPQAAGPRRYKMAHWGYAGSEDTVGMWIEFSADGLTFTPHDKNPVLKYTENVGDVSLSDIIDGCWDPLKKHYMVCYKTIGWETDGYRGHTANITEGRRRGVGQSTSKDFINWTPARRIVMPDPEEPGVWEFLGMRPIVRGSLYIGFLRVLRDDLPVDPGGAVEGHGVIWTELCTSRDGESWSRHRGPFLDKGGPDDWDHARAMVGECVTVGDRDYIYYGGGSIGHKSDSGMIGLAVQRRNGFVSRDATAGGGRLRTPLVILESLPLRVNANVTGELHVRILDETGNPLPGMDWLDCRPITGDGLAHAVTFRGGAVIPKDQPIHIEFWLRDARLYAFDLGGK